jgi:hypothetical protein
MSAAILPEIRWRAIDEDANVIPGALLYAYAAGTDTPQDTYTTSDLDVANSNPVEADDGGLFPPIYLGESAGYKFVLTDADDVEIWSQDQVLDPGAYFASNFGTAMAVGSRNVTTGYTLLSTDRLVTVASSGATTFNLLAASSFTGEVTIKNMSGGTVVITPNGSDTIDTLATFTLEAAGTPTFPAVTLRPVTGGWLIVSSHRVA